MPKIAIKKNGNLPSAIHHIRTTYYVTRVNPVPQTASVKGFAQQ
jgi:hypothetical protein